MSNYAQQAKIVKENVLTLLEEIPQTRNSDRLLLIKYWERFDQIPMDENFAAAFVSRATGAESITRARRGIQSGGLYLPTEEEVLKQRRINQEEARQHHANNQ